MAMTTPDTHTKPLLLTRPFDEMISNEGYDQAAAWARLVERGLRELRYRQREDAPALSEVSIAETIQAEPTYHTGVVIPLHGYSVKV